MYVKDDAMAVQKSDDSETLKFAVALVQSGASATENEKARYQYMTKQLQEAPFFTLERSKIDTRKWSQRKVTVKDALERFLPQTAYEKLTQNCLSDAQDVMDLQGDMYKDFLSNIWCQKISESKEVTEVMQIEEPDPATCKVSVYYVHLLAEYEAGRKGFRKKESRKLTAEYRYMEFTALTSILKEIRRKKDEPMVAKSLAWLAKMESK